MPTGATTSHRVSIEWQDGQMGTRRPDPAAAFPTALDLELAFAKRVPVRGVQAVRTGPVMSIQGAVAGMLRTLSTRQLPSSNRTSGCAFEPFVIGRAVPDDGVVAAVADVGDGAHLGALERRGTSAEAMSCPIRSGRKSASTARLSPAATAFP